MARTRRFRKVPLVGTLQEVNSDTVPEPECELWKVTEIRYIDLFVPGRPSVFVKRAH